MHKFEVLLALEAVADARKAWSKAWAKFNSDTDLLFARLLNEAAVHKMSVTAVAEATGMTPTKVRALMRKHGLNPKTGRNLLAAQAARTLEENSALLGVEPHEFDLMSPLAYLPMGSDLRKFLETNRMDGDDLDAIDRSPERELADFNPATSHLHTCAKNETSDVECDSNCIHHLYAVAEDTQRAMVTA